MTLHIYNSRSNSLVSNGNGLESKSDNRPATLYTCKLIINLKKKILTLFDDLGKELLNIKGVKMKDLQTENQQLHSKINNLEKKVVSLEENGNQLEQGG